MPRPRPPCLTHLQKSAFRVKITGMKKLTKKQKNEILARIEQAYGGTGPALRFGSV